MNGTLRQVRDLPRIGVAKPYREQRSPSNGFDLLLTAYCLLLSAFCFHCQSPCKTNAAQ